jgi:predicted 2-oxoglutarate/Fe(II)-dependent dioxygenase YbiX
MFLKDYIVQFNNFLPLKTVSTLIRFAKTKNFEEAKVGIGEGRVDEKVRKVGRYVLSPLNKSLSDCHWSRLLEYKINLFIKQYIINKNLIEQFPFGMSINQIELLKYKKTNHYKFHIDQAKTLERSLSAVVILNNDYKGGELVFKNTINDEQIKMELIAGSLVVFPSNFLFPHAVKPVTEGIRYSIVAWAC